MALCRSAGFARVDFLGVTHQHARLACHRQWEPEPLNPSFNPPVLSAALNSRRFGLNFQSRREEYVTCWFTSNQPDLRREDFRPEVGGYGSPALNLKDEGGARHVTFRLPPGLDAGWHEVRLRTANSSFSNAIQIAVDVPVEPGNVRIRAISDGVTWSSTEISIIPEDGCGYLTLWVEGLSRNSDRNNVHVFCDDRRLRIAFISASYASGAWQINAIVPDQIGVGEKTVRIECAGITAEPVTVMIRR
jgi:hypothetical protein